MSKCDVKYIGKIISQIDDFFLIEEDKSLENLESYVKEGIPGLHQDFSLETYIKNSKDFSDMFSGLVELYDLSLDTYIKGIDSKFINTKSNVSRNFSTDRIVDLFHTLPLAKARFENFSIKKILTAFLIGQKSSNKFVSSNSEISKNFTALKNDLFLKIQDFLSSKNIIKKSEIQDLYNSNGDIIDYNHYKKIMNLIDDYFFSDESKLIKTYSNKKGIPNLSMDTVENSDLFDSYNASILLSNFDSVLQEYFSGIVDINYNLFNNLRSNLESGDKYSKKIEGIKTEYWRKDTHETESSEEGESKLIKLLVSTIPIYNKKGIDSGVTMEMKDLYLIAAMISDFEIVNGNRLKNKEGSNFIYFNESPKKALLQYLDNVDKAFNGLDGDTLYKEHFQYNYEFILSLKKFIESEELNILSKEDNSKESIIEMIAQVINNNFGASYLTYNSNGKYTIREMYKQNFNTIHLQDSVFEKILRSKNEKLYDVEKNKDEIDELFKNINDGTNLLLIPKEAKIAINSYIGKRTGIYLSYLGFDDLIVDIRKHQENLTVTGFKNMLTNFSNAVIEDRARIKKAVENKQITDTSKDINSGDYIQSLNNNSLFKGHINAFLINYPVKAVMNISLLSGEKLPTFKLANLTQKDTEIFELQRDFEKSGTSLFKSLLIKDTPAILGTGTKLELINGEDNKSASKFNIQENFTSDFQLDFLKNIESNGNFSIMLGNYSDKNTILTKIINGSFKIQGNSKTILQYSQKELLNIVKLQGGSFYKNTLVNVLADLNFLLGRTDKRVVETNVKKIESDIKELNIILENTDVRTLSKKASDNGIKILEELHFSKYEGKFKLNQLLVDNYRIFNDDDLFNDFVKLQENEVIRKFKKYNKSSEIKFLKDIDLKKISEKLGIEEKEFPKKETNGKENIDYTQIESSGELNPLLKKWLWTNALFRNEYLFVTGKGEYMHPHKVKSLSFRGNSNGLLSKNDKEKTAYWKNFQEEMSGRLSSMAKRNVIYTATIESPVRNSKLGVPDDINMAVIDDHRDELFNITGNTKNQEVHDGSSYINYIYSLMLDNSFPGKGYNGTKKQFATFVTESGVTIKKDAESVITNRKILDSRNSKISFLGKQKQMLGIDVQLPASFKFNESFKNEFFFNKLGVIYRIETIDITKNNYAMVVSRKNGNKWTLEQEPISGKFNNLYQLWELFGAQYSTDIDNNFNEGSNELLYRIVTTQNGEGKYPLKNAMIHVLSNISAVKAGAANVNDRKLWTSDEPLAYTSFKNRFMGPQLDASHDANDSRIKEITQVISSLAQNSDTAHLAQEAYEDIATVIKNAAKPYVKYMKFGKDINKSDLYKYLSEKFVKTIENSKGDNIAKILVQSFSQDTIIPFSNQNFFIPFVRDVITRMNNEFISRYYSGIGAVLIPSHGIIQVYDIPQADGTVKIMTQADITKEALSAGIFEGVASNDELIEAHIRKIAPPQDITWGEIMLGDTVEVPKEPRAEARELLKNNLGLLQSLKDQYGDNELYINQLVSRYLDWNFGNNKIPKEIDFNNFNIFLAEDALSNDTSIEMQEVTLSNPDIYYYYKELHSGNEPVRKLTRPRDLKPSEITFTWNGRKNLFDLDSIRLRYKFEKMYKNKMLNESDKEFIHLSNFYTKVSNGRNLIEDFKTDSTQASNILIKYLNLWTKRNLNLLELNRVMKSVNTSTMDEIFGEDNLVKLFREVKDSYMNITEEISDYDFKAAELILGNLYNSKFNTDSNSSIYEIKSKGSEYFKESLEKLFEEDSFKADMKLIVEGVDHPIYIKYTDKLPGNDYKLNIKLERPLDNGDITRKFVRLNEKGEKIYVIPDHNYVRAIEQDGREVIYVKAASSVKSKEGKILNIEEPFKENLANLINSFEGSIRTIVPLMGSDSDIVDKLKLNKVTLNEFSKFSNYVPIDKNNLDTEWFELHKKHIIDKLSKKMYASWEKSHEFVVARIPAQSMQSFMQMQNIAYMQGNSNDAFVSVWQIWLQGSDFR